MSILGAAMFFSENDQIHVDESGTIRFNLSLKFTESGCAGLMEEISRFILVNDSAMMPVVECDAAFTIPCTFSGDVNGKSQWWTVEVDEHSVVYVLHQVRSTDRGAYTAVVESLNPATESLRTIEKHYFVSGEFYPVILIDDRTLHYIIHWRCYYYCYFP